MAAKEHFKGIEGKWKMESRTGYEVSNREKENHRTKLMVFWWYRFRIDWNQAGPGMSTSWIKPD